MVSPNESSTNNPSQGLGKPLVTVSTIHGSAIRPSTGAITPATVPAGADHPLANMTTPPPPPPPPPPPMTVSSTSNQSSVSTSATSNPTNTSPQQSAEGIRSVPTPNMKISNKPVSPVLKSLDSLADAFMAGSSYRLAELKLPPLIKPPPLPPDEAGLQRLVTLVKRRAWGDVLQVCGDMLRSASSPHSAVYTSLITYNETHPDSTPLLQQETVETMMYECHAWLKLRRYADLGREVAKWTFCRINDVTAQPPDWVPSSLLVLAAVSLQYTDSQQSQRCVDELYALRAVTEDNVECTLSIDAALSNVFLRQKEWRMSLQSLDNILVLLPRVHTGDLLQALQAEIWSRQGRILLQVGAIDQAEQIFAKTIPAAAQDYDNRNWIVAKIPAQIALHQGLVHFARKNYNEAMNAFKQTSDLLRSIPEPSDGGAYLSWVESPQCLMMQAWNNMSLCALYTCRMKEAVRLMESLVREDPTLYLTERLAFNLCTLYELGTDTTASARKKRVLQLVAKRFYLHDIGPEQFRVT